MRSKVIMLFSGTLIIAAVSSAITIQFAADEGYSGDGITWASRLDAQVPTVGTNWVETQGGSLGRFRVDSSGGGALHMDGDAGFNKAIYQEAISATTEVYQVGVKFSFNRATNELASQQDVIAVELTEVATGGNRIAVKFERQKEANSGKYRLTFWDSSGSANTSGNAGWSDESDWGFATSEDVASDELWLGMTLYRGADASSWLVSGVISNMNTGFIAEMPTNTVGLFDTSSAFFTDPLYAVVNSSAKDVDLNTSNRQVDLFAVGTPEFPVSEPDPEGFSETVDFTAAEGYSDGTLVANSSWSGHTDATVDSTAGLVQMDGASNYKRVAYNSNLGIADRYTVGAEFSFNRVEGATLSGNMEVFAVEFGDAASTSAGRIAIQLQRLSWNTTWYRLAFYENSSSVKTSANGSGTTEDNFGFGTGDDLSDDLWISMTLTRGTNASSWTVTGVLSNLTAGTQVLTLPETTIDTDSTYFDGNVYGMMNSVRLESDSQVSNRLVDVFYIAAESDPVPEPSTPYEAWTAGFSLSGDDALMDADPDGDGYNNMLEYGLGGDPATADDSIHIPAGAVNGDLFELVHVALTNSESGIDYIVETTTDLVSGTWTNVGITTVSAPLGSDPSFDSVTNRISMDGVPAGFLRLRIVEL